MDRITKALLDEFVVENSLMILEEDKAFEHFASYVATSNHYSDSYSTYEIVVGAGDDCGIDCISVIVNGYHVTEPEEIKDLSETNGYLDVSLIFVQAERSPNFETAKIGQFGFGVVDFFSEKPSLRQNNQVALKAKIINEIYSRSSMFKKGNPQCFLYYITTGRWVHDQNLINRSNAVKKDLEDTGLFKKVSFECLGAEKVQNIYRDLKNAISREIVFNERTVLPELPCVEQSYIGILPATEFLKLIENESGEMLATIFNDNIRDWQDWNDVNTEIQTTLSNDLTKIYFPLLNNGITIVAKKIIPTGNRFFIEDYQIVNGCQSSCVLHDSRSNLNENVLIPVRLISTQDIEIKNMIIKATNRQTPISDEMLFVLTDFPKKLEVFFPTYNGNKKLYYERRPRQYNSYSNIERVRIINMTTLIRAFASIFLDQPHRTTRNYKALLKLIGADIFNKEHRLEMYYLAAFAHYRLEYLFRNQTISSELKPARYHLLMAFRKICNTSSLPRLNSREMERYCNSLLEVLWDEQRYKDVFAQSSVIVSNAADSNFHRDNIRTEPFTRKVNEEVMKYIGKEVPYIG